MNTNRWDRFYIEDPRVLTAPPSLSISHAVSLFKRHRCKTILDLGCGIGRDTRPLVSAGFHVTASDLSFSALSIAQAKFQPNILAIQGDSCSLPFLPESFDGVYCFGLLHEFLMPRARKQVIVTISEIHRILIPGGLAFITVLSGHPAKGLPYVRLFTRNMLSFNGLGLNIVKSNNFNDIGCTGSKNYRIWQTVYKKPKHKSPR
jgi:SAM-dependent methyltransferase